MRYFIKIPALACAETDSTAARLIARGYKECPQRFYLAYWKLRHDARMAELLAEARRAWPPLLIKEIGATRGW